jgi:hypothetical protein
MGLTDQEQVGGCQSLGSWSWASAEVGVLYRLTSNARLAAEYGFRRNNSNIDRYAYTSNRYMVRFQYIF